MKILKAFWVVVVLTVLAGCSTTGGTIGGLFPAPKFIKGAIKDDIYTAKDGSFSTALPYTQDSYEYTYMELKEHYDSQGVYVSLLSARILCQLWSGSTQPDHLSNRGG